MNVLGLKETYRSNRFIPAVGSHIGSAGSYGVEATVLAVRSRPERLKVRFQNQLYDDVEFETKPATGTRLASR